MILYTSINFYAGVHIYARSKRNEFELFAWSLTVQFVIHVILIDWQKPQLYFTKASLVFIQNIMIYKFGEHCVHSKGNRICAIVLAQIQNFASTYFKTILNAKKFTSQRCLQFNNLFVKIDFGSFYCWLLSVFDFRRLFMKNKNRTE